MSKVKQKYLTYAGIGSRKTPKSICKLFTDMSTQLEENGFILRTGGAKGADEAFLDGITNPDPVELYLPWQGYNDYESPMHKVPKASIALASKFHPAWDNCSEAVRKMHGRNANIILGKDVLRPQPCEFVICYTEGAKAQGGTGMAITIADAYLIPVFDFGLNTDYVYNQLAMFLERYE